MTDPRLTEAVEEVRGELEHWDSPGFDDAEVRVKVGTLRTLLAALDAMTAERDDLQERDKWAQGEFKRWGKEYATMISAYGDLQRENATLRARLERAEADTARLDFLERDTRRKHTVELAFSREGFEPGEYGTTLSSWPDEFSVYGCDSDCRGPDLRAALDAARGAPQEDAK